MVDQVIGCLPERWQAGHRPGDDPDRVDRLVKVRADTAGGTRKMTTGLVAILITGGA